MNIKKLITILISSVLLVGVVYILIQVAPRFLEELRLKKELAALSQAADFSLPDLNGKKVALADFRGRKVILQFWTSWNKLSIEQLKVLNSYYNAKSGDTAVLAVNSQEDSAMVKNVVGREKLSLTVLLDSDGEAGYLYDIGVLPLTVFVNPAGLIVERVEGPVPFEEIQNRVNRL